MPDVHLGKGSTIGSVIPTKGAIIPAAVGVDIGCGMIAVRTSLVASDLPDNLSGLRSAIEQAVPHGRTSTRSGRDKGRGKRRRRKWITTGQCWRHGLNV
jgi:tRNA-splicing ligase RtcB